jgi:hypothetical protein
MRFFQMRFCMFHTSAFIVIYCGYKYISKKLIMLNGHELLYLVS